MLYKTARTAQNYGLTLFSNPGADTSPTEYARCVRHVRNRLRRHSGMRYGGPVPRIIRAKFIYHLGIKVLNGKERESTGNEIPVPKVLQDLQNGTAGTRLLRIVHPGMDHQLQQMGQRPLVRPLIRSEYLTRFSYEYRCSSLRFIEISNRRCL